MSYACGKTNKNPRAYVLERKFPNGSYCITRNKHDMRTCQTGMVNIQKQYKNDLKNPLVIFHVAMENRWKIHHDSVGKPSIDGR
jgi:hypothetical protein